MMMMDEDILETKKLVDIKPLNYKKKENDNMESKSVSSVSSNPPTASAKKKQRKYTEKMAKHLENQRAQRISKAKKKNEIVEKKMKNFDKKIRKRVETKLKVDYSLSIYDVLNELYQDLQLNTPASNELMDESGKNENSMISSNQVFKNNVYNYDTSAPQQKIQGYEQNVMDRNTSLPAIGIIESKVGRNEFTLQDQMNTQGWYIW